MTFGEIGIFSDAGLGQREYRGKKLTINWGGDDDMKSEIEFDLFATSNGKGGDVIINQAVRVTDGVGVGTKSDNSLTLTIIMK